MCIRDSKRPLLMVPNLANHIKRESEKNAEPNKQTDMLPIIAAFQDSLPDENFFLGLLAQEAGVSRSDILDYELYIYNLSLIHICVCCPASVPTVRSPSLVSRTAHRNFPY